MTVHLADVHPGETQPDPATIRSEATGEPAPLLGRGAVLGYPLLAACLGCGATIRLWNTSVLGEWEHVADVPRPAPAP